MYWLLHWLIYALAILLTAWLLPGVRVTGFGAALIAALVLGLINAILRPILVFLTLPLTILTLGLFVLVINTVLIMFVSALVPGFAVQNFWWALLFGVILSIINFVLVKSTIGY